MLSNLRAWITQATGLPIYQGWHGWHLDGPAAAGRFHKLFIMVDKRRGPGYTPHTNVLLVPPASAEAHACAFRPLMEAVMQSEVGRTYRSSHFGTDGSSAPPSPLPP